MKARESKMSDKSNQTISELMDGELSSDCSRFLLKRMQSDSDLRESWNNYHMLRSCLQQEHQAPLFHDLGAAVVAKLKFSQIEQATAKDHGFNRILKAVSGVAIAASVAVVAVLSFNNNTIDGAGNTEVFAKTAQQIIIPPKATVVRVEQPIGFSRYPSLTPQVQQYIYDTNNQQSIPVYYNTEYFNRVVINSQLPNNQNIAEE
jgi:negative regulator of sigma E activity